MIGISSILQQTMWHTIVILILKASIVQTTNCVMEQDQCVFTNVYTSVSNWFFDPEYSDLDEVEKVFFLRSSIYALTYELCDKFSNLNTINANNVSMKHIHSDTFGNCSNLQQLIIPNNELSELNVYRYPVLELLKYIDVEDNHLFDFDEQELLFKFPNLKTFLLSGNQINCDRLRSIIGTFRKENVGYHKISSVEKFFEENPFENVDGINCVSKKKHIMDLIRRILQEFLFVEIEEIIEILEEIASDVENLNLQQSYINSTVSEITEYFEETFVPLEEIFFIAEENVSNQSTNIFNINENLVDIIKENDKNYYIAIINERNINNLEEETAKLSDSITKFQEEVDENFIEIRNVKYSIKTKFESSQQLYYISLALFIVIIIVAIATITIVMNIIYC